MIAQAPRLRPGLEPYWDAFWTLSTCRQMGMGPGPIPWLAVDRYAERHGIAGDGFLDLCDILHEMDEAFMAHVAAKNKD